VVRLNEGSPSPHSTIDVWQLGGAMSRFAADATAFGDHSVPFLIGIEANWESPNDDHACVNWGREVFRALEPGMVGAYCRVRACPWLTGVFSG
jgi:hypothetical protein